MVEKQCEGAKKNIERIIQTNVIVSRTVNCHIFCVIYDAVQMSYLVVFSINMFKMSMIESRQAS